MHNWVSNLSKFSHRGCAAPPLLSGPSNMPLQVHLVDPLNLNFNPSSACLFFVWELKRSWTNLFFIEDMKHLKKLELVRMGGGASGASMLRYWHYRCYRCYLILRLTGVSQRGERGAHTVSNRGYSPDCHVNLYAMFYLCDQKILKK